MGSQQLLLGAGVAKDPIYTEDIFAAHTYEGTSGSQSIVNGIDLAEHGGLVIIKRLDGSSKFIWYDSKRGVRKRIESTGTDIEHEASATVGLISFNNNGFTLGTNNAGDNANETDIVSYTFRICPKFFDIQIWDGNGTSGREISHNLDAVPGMVIVKRRNSGSTNWAVYHRRMDNSNPENYYARLNLVNDRVDDAGAWNDTAPTSTKLTLGNSAETNESGGTYVGYFFAHNEAAFGDSGTETISHCGGEAQGVYNGYEGEDTGWPTQFQFSKMVTNTAGNSTWFMAEDMIGNSMKHPTTELSDPDGPLGGFLRFDKMDQTYSTNIVGNYTATSGVHNGSGFILYQSSQVINYAIRQVDGYTCKKPSAGSDLLTLVTGGSGGGLNSPSFATPFKVSFFQEMGAGQANNFMGSRKQGAYYDSGSQDRGKGRVVTMNQTWDESPIGYNDLAALSYNRGWGYSRNGFYGYGWRESQSSTCVGYYGHSSAQTITHFMNAVPTFIIVKARGLTGSWRVYHAGLNEGSSPENYSLQMDDNSMGGDVWNGTAPTSTAFSVGTDSNVNSNNEPYIAYLWADSSYSKAGYYTGNGGTQSITVGFQPRFLVIRRYNVGANTSGAPDSSWIVFDTNKGWGSGNDTVKWWNKNSSPGTGTDYCDPTSTGFTLNAGEAYTNNNNDKYIYFAHA